MNDQIIVVVKYLLRITIGAFVIVTLLLGITLFINENPEWRIENYLAVEKRPMTEESLTIFEGKEKNTGLLDGKGLSIVIVNCTRCHSAKLIAQNRANREGWISMIRWMQETQNLWDLGENEEIILDYLSKNYAPEKIGRRNNLTDIEWYSLQD